MNTPTTDLEKRLIDKVAKQAARIEQLESQLARAREIARDMQYDVYSNDPGDRTGAFRND